jgi:hypothetical protein
MHEFCMHQLYSANYGASVWSQSTGTSMPSPIDGNQERIQKTGVCSIVTLPVAFVLCLYTYLCNLGTTI